MTKEITELIQYLKEASRTPESDFLRWATAVEQLQEAYTYTLTQLEKAQTVVEAYERILDKGTDREKFLESMVDAYREICINYSKALEGITVNVINGKLEDGKKEHRFKKAIFPESEDKVEKP